VAKQEPTEDKKELFVIHKFHIVKLPQHSIALFHYDITSKQIYCLNAKNHGRGYNKFRLIKNKLRDYSK